MSQNKRYYWLKFRDDFFTSKRIKKLQKLGNDYLVIYLKMQIKALKNEGVLEITGIEKTIAEEIALDIDEDPDKVQLTLSFLQACGLVETMDDGDLFLPYVKENIGSETASTQRSRECRDRQKVLQCNASATLEQQSCNVEKDIEKEIDYISLIRDIVEYLNEKSRKNFKTSSEKTRKCIKARLNEGFTLEDFKKVIDIKCKQWLGNRDMEQYLRPETLFGTKFEGYLNQGGGTYGRESQMAETIRYTDGIDLNG